MLSLDENRAAQLFQNYVIENPDATPQKALAITAALLINGQEGVRNLRNLLEAAYSDTAWYRLKKSLKVPQPHRFTHFKGARGNTKTVQSNIYK